MRLRILMVASELYPFVKTGGLADVISSLSRALAVQGAEVQLILPGYRALQSRVATVDESYELEGAFTAKIPFVLSKCRLSGFDLPVWLVDCPQLYHHPGSIYDEPTGFDQNLNAMRFATLSWAAALVGCGISKVWQPDVVHSHDWHAALTPVFIRRLLKIRNAPGPLSVLTIHNLAFQGHFSRALIDVLKMSRDEVDEKKAQATNTFCFLQSGIQHADKVTTVSPTYAREILGSEHGCGLEPSLKARRDGVKGILNGVDYSVWNPTDDRHLPVNFSGDGKTERARIRAHLQSECNLSASATVPILTFSNRLTHQKMVDVLIEVLPKHLAQGCQFVAMGNGQPEYVAAFKMLATRFPKRVYYLNGYDEGLEHRFHAGGDICLSPSRFEPCGLNPLYAMRYGSVPLVRATGGLIDSIVDAEPAALASGKSNGIMFKKDDASSLNAAIARALNLFTDKATWEKLQRRGMIGAFRWKTAADQYRSVYTAAAADRNVARMQEIIANTVSGPAFAASIGRS